MILLLPEHREKLRANTLAREEAYRLRKAEPDPIPVVKFFNPCGAATWLATELEEDGDTLFGLADLGFGCPELGSFSLREIESVRLPFGLTIERDIGFDGQLPLSIWAETARFAGSILSAEPLVREIAATLPKRPDLPPQ